MRQTTSLAFASLLCVAGCSQTDTRESELEAALAHRLRGDWTGACVVAAVIDQDVQRAVFCADPTRARKLSAASAFEIGSISKTMTGYLLADQIEQGTLSLDDTLAQHLPAGTVVPDYQGKPIRLSHLASHTSGLPVLPARISIADPNNPYASLTQDELIGSLADVNLMNEPGSVWAYSNYGYMLLSHIVAQHAEGDVETLLHERLFTPLGMNAFISRAPDEVQRATGHLPNGKRTSPWDFPSDVAGMGGVRASLDDMIRYAQALMGQGDPAVQQIMTRALTPIYNGPPQMALAWIVAQLGDRQVISHAGGTGGFSSLIIVEPSHKKAVVLLSDTALTSLGGLGGLGMHLLEPSLADNPGPRVFTTPDATLLSALSGRFKVDTLSLELEERKGKLWAKVEGQSDVKFEYDSYGDFVPLALDAALTPVKTADGTMTFDWKQGGGVLRAQRLP
jgi:serine-type D-Ala-D-Ala carboxypeptidase/endopeptidase